MKLAIAVFCFLAAFAAVKADGKSMGPVGNIIVGSISDCDEKYTSQQITLHSSTKTVDDKGTKAFYADLDNKVPIDSTFEYNLEVYKWNSGWKSHLNHSGNFCQDIQKFLPKVWQRVRTTATPPIPAPCPIEPGKYSVEKFQCLSKDVDIPSVFYGRIKVQAVISQNGKPMYCVTGEGDSQAPQ